ncbi:MAG TPA: IS1595 family transposase [Candidatus Binataceae bacterium]|nr:IS1595 family transposase [Candidatus Binataceae bacterium]
MMTLRQLMETFPTSDAYKQFLMDRRWPDGKVKCVRCGNEKVYASKVRPFHWQCRNHGHPYRFSVLVGTVFENTNYPLKTWFEVLWQMLNSKKGVSAMQIQRQIGSSYPTAWFLCHRLRAGMRDDQFKQLMGIVEIDETGLGGKDKNRHWDKKQHITGPSGKTTVIGAIARKGNVVCQVIENADATTLNKFVRKTVSGNVDLVATDENKGYAYLDALGFPHETVSHSAGEYVRGKVHTNSIEGFWSLLKRGIVGTYHNVSKKYLPLYLAEFQYRYNNRKNPDIFGEAVAGC